MSKLFSPDVFRVSQRNHDSLCGHEFGQNNLALTNNKNEFKLDIDAFSLLDSLTHIECVVELVEEHEDAACCKITL
jgi:hypothetical protein